MNIEEFMERLCSYSYTTKVWYVLYEGGGAYRYSELLQHVRCSPTTLSETLSRLLVDSLVKMVGTKYQAVQFPWLKKAEK